MKKVTHKRKPTVYSTLMVFLSYKEGSKAYRIYDPEAKKLHVTRDVVFPEEKKWDWALTLTESIDGGDNFFTFWYTVDHITSALVNIINTTPTIDEGSLR